MTAPAVRSGQGMTNTYLTALGIDSSTATSTQRTTALAELNDAYREMLRGVYQNERGERLHHLWSFMHPTSTTLTVSALANASYTHQDIVFTAAAAGTGGNDVTVTISSGASTAASESGDDITITYASAATTAEVVAACSALTVATVTGGSATAATALAETHLTLAVAGTACPTSFGGLIEPPRYGYDAQDSKAGQQLIEVSPERMDELIRDWNGEDDDPESYCVRPKAQSASAGSTYEFVFFPPPEDDMYIYIRYRIDPADLTDSSSAYAVGNYGVEQLIVALARAAKERAAGAEGVETRKAMRLFADLVMEDRNLYPTETFQLSMAEEETGLTP